MKILVPLEIPEGSYSLIINAVAASDGEMKEMDYEFDESNIGQFRRFEKLFETELVKQGII